jgi:hypothetical protein
VWTTEITEQQTDKKIAWQAIDGEVKNDGVVTFQQIGDGQTRGQPPDGRRERVDRGKRRERSSRRRQGSGAS